MVLQRYPEEIVKISDEEKLTLGLDEKTRNKLLIEGEPGFDGYPAMKIFKWFNDNTWDWKVFGGLVDGKIQTETETGQEGVMWPTVFQIMFDYLGGEMSQSLIDLAKHDRAKYRIAGTAEPLLIYEDKLIRRAKEERERKKEREEEEREENSIKNVPKAEAKGDIGEKKDDNHILASEIFSN